MISDCFDCEVNINTSRTMELNIGHSGCPCDYGICDECQCNGKFEPLIEQLEE